VQSYATALLIAGVAVCTAAPLAAQVDKPISEPTARLPAPKIVATQLPNGPIQVTWSAVDGAVKYSLTRSVPPAAIQPVVLPNPADTQYIDTDVRVGSTYYYLVAAVNEAGTMGLKAGSAPVKALDLSVPAPPVNVRAAVSGSAVVLTWGGLSTNRYRIEQGTINATGSPGFVPMGDRDCCQFSVPLQSLAPGTRIVYQVAALSPTGYLSSRVVSNEISVPGAAPTDTGNVASSDSAGAADTSASAGATARVRPAVVAPTAKLRVGSTLKLSSSVSFSALQLRQVHWVSLNESSATVSAQGQVRGVAPGTTHVIASGLTPDGAVASLVQRIEVTR
jgi:hypothetical protein